MKSTVTVEKKVGIYLLALTVFKILYTMGLNVGEDEAYYFLWSKHLGWSYFDHPPMIAYLLALLSHLVPSKEIVVDLLPILLGAGTSVYAFLLARELFDKKTAFPYVLLINLPLVLFAGSLVATPDAPMIFFLTGATYHFYLATRNGKARSWFLTGLLIGLSLLSKYVSVLIYPAFLLYLLLGDNRKWLRTRLPYLAFLISVIIFLPVVMWNLGNEWVSFRFQLGHGLGGKFPAWDSFAEFLGGQAVIIGPILFFFFLVCLLWVLARWKQVSGEEKLLWAISVVFFSFFLISSLQKKAEPNWPVFAYIPGILLMVRFYKTRWGGTKWARTLWVSNWMITVGLLALVLIHIYLPFLNLKKDPTDQFFGWDKAGEEVAHLADKNQGFLLAANRLQVASQLAFYAGKPFFCFNIASRPNQFTLWQEGSSFAGKDFLFFDAEEHLKTEVVKHFEEIELIGSLPLKRRERTMKLIYVYRAYGYH